MIKIWLPPLEVCCDKAEIEVVVAKNETIGIKTSCPEHKNHFIKSPFASSRKGIKIRFSSEIKEALGIKNKNQQITLDEAQEIFK